MNAAGPRITIINARRPAGSRTVVVAGELEIGTVPAFQEQIHAILRSVQGEQLNLDLSTLEFCDLAGLRALQALESTAVENAYRLRVTAAAPCLDVILELCQISAMLGYMPARKA